MTSVAGACLPEHDTRDRLLLLIERFVERLEDLGQGLHLRGPLGHTLAGAVEPLGQRRPRAILLARRLALLAQLLALGRGCAQLRLDWLPELALGGIALQRFLDHGEAAFLKPGSRLRGQLRPLRLPLRSGLGVWRRLALGKND